MLTYLMVLLVFFIFLAILFKFSFGFSLKGKITVATIILFASIIGSSIQQLFTPWHSLLLILLLLLLATIFLQKRPFMYHTNKNVLKRKQNVETGIEENDSYFLKSSNPEKNEKKLEALSDDLTLK
ncbi:MAG: hypothetical protein ACQEV7_07340 [Bacillota bacterium]